MPGNSRKHLVKRQVEVSEGTKGRDDVGRTGDSVQGSSDGLDVLPTTSILCGLQLLDKVGTGWTCAIDDIHCDQRRKGRPGEGIRSGEVKGRDGNACGMSSRRLLRYSIGPVCISNSISSPRATVLLVITISLDYPTMPPALSSSLPNLSPSPFCSSRQRESVLYAQRTCSST
jgi:hypothetical protein